MNRLFQPMLIITFFLAYIASPLGQSCELVMGYQNKAKPPLINKAPDNSGIYLDIYSLAAQKIDCAFKVIRLPKIRVLQQMKRGIVDFYPGMKFSEERSIYAHFIPNSLTTGRVGLSLIGMPLITHKTQLAGFSVLIALGGINYVDEIDGLKVHQVLNLDIEKAAKMLVLKRGHFFATDPFVVDNFLKNTKEAIYKKHPNCCGGIKPMYIGFSKKSEYLIEMSNPKYNKELAININNFSHILKKDSIAYEFGAAVREVVKGYQYQ
ncbi:MAG: hypothetical protein V7785_23565 [Bermanella sp.]